ncbi:MAG: DUF4965 domain-containing protein [Planctomycetaceae bacterium]|jgi:hypothetical protein|nr:DUF4965 domain-containing protein [Planctomycetaceae bacterium]
MLNVMKKFLTVCFAVAIPAVSVFAAEPVVFRPPSVPLVVHDPYFSIWSPADKLTDAETVHWTGAKHPLHCMIRINGKTYRLMGAEPKDVPAMEQKDVIVLPTETVYFFGCDEAQIDLRFTTPVVPSDLELLSRPVTYITCRAITKDGMPLKMAFYFDAGAEIAVNTPEQKIQWSKLDVPGTATIKLGTVEQNVLGRKGDNVRIDWGHLILSAHYPFRVPMNYRMEVPIDSMEGFANVKTEFNMVAGNGESFRKLFVENVSAKSPYSEDISVEANGTVIAFTGFTEEPRSGITARLILAYDDEYSIRYFEDVLRPWWKRNGKTTEKMIIEAWVDAFDSFAKTEIFFLPKEEKPALLKCENFNLDFLAHSRANVEDYAKLCALAYRQSLGAQKIVADSNGMPLMFSKENFSNGSIGTVDVMYPASPMLLYYSPALMKATLQPILDYGASPRWKFPFAPHDLGTYPHATGQTYGGGETSEKNQMPVEESANMLIQVAALAFAEENADYAKQHWTILTKWAEYLLEKGYDPENQLCTDDFAGHLAHNINLSAKAIIGLGCYAQLAEQLGEKESAAKYRKAAEEFAARWVKEATEDDHTKLAFDKPGTWSMKYNLMWNEILGLKLFPREVIDKELAFYKTKMQPYGLPLDNRSLYTKNDWILWIAAMTNNREDFDVFVKSVIGFLNNTDKRVPLSDWYFTDTAKHRGFQARSVIGGFWAPMLKNAELWKAQAKEGADVAGKWAEITLPGKVVAVIVPTAQRGKTAWRYMTEDAAEGWERPDFDDSGWKEGLAGFGTKETPGAIIGTEWNTKKIRLRRIFEWNGEIPAGTEPVLSMHHDEDVEVYLNGELITTRSGWLTGYEIVKTPQLLKALKKGTNTLAVRCRQNDGGQYIDVGIVLTEAKKKSKRTATQASSSGNK